MPPLPLSQPPKPQTSFVEEADKRASGENVHNVRLWHFLGLPTRVTMPFFLVSRDAHLHASLEMGRGVLLF